MASADNGLPRLWPHRFSLNSSVALSLLWSRAVGVAHAANVAAPSKSIPPVCLAVDLTFGPPLGVFGVGQLASATVLRPLSVFPASLYPFWAGVPAIGVGHEPQSLSDVRRPDAASWQYGRPAGVAFAFHVSENNVEPAPSNCRFNLLSKDCWRAPLRDERKPRRPQVAFVIACLARAGGRERLAGTTSCPNRSIIGPTGLTEGDRPAADACEEMGLAVAPEIVGPHVNDASLVNVAWCDLTGFDEVAEPLCGIGVDLVVVGGHLGIFPY